MAFFSKTNCGIASISPANRPFRMASSYRRLYCSGILDLGNENEFTDFFGGTLGNVKEWDTVKWPPGAKREPMKCFRVGERGKMARLAVADRGATGSSISRPPGVPPDSS